MADQIDRRLFWQELNQRIDSKSDTPLSTTTQDDAENDNWRSQPNIAASTGIGFNVRIQDDQMMVYLIPRDRATREGVFEHLRQFKDEIDGQFDRKLEWRPPNQSTKIVLRKEGVNLQNDSAEWDVNLNWLIEKGEEFHSVFRPYLLRFQGD